MKRVLPLAVVALMILAALWLYFRPREAEQTVARSAPEQAKVEREKVPERHPMQRLSPAPAALSIAKEEGKGSLSGRVIARDDGSAIADAELSFAHGEA